MANEASSSDVSTFGGWLWLLEIVLAVTFLGESVRTIWYLYDALRHLNFVSTHLGNPAVQNALLHLARSAVAVAGTAVLLVFLSKRSRTFPKIAVAWFCFTPVFNLLYLTGRFYVSHDPGYSGARIGPFSIASLATSTLVSLLWCSYLLKSARVRGFFTKAWPSSRPRSVA